MWCCQLSWAVVTHSLQPVLIWKDVNDVHNNMQIHSCEWLCFCQAESSCTQSSYPGTHISPGKRFICASFMEKCVNIHVNTVYKDKIRVCTIILYSNNSASKNPTWQQPKLTLKCRDQNHWVMSWQRDPSMMIYGERYSCWLLQTCFLASAAPQDKWHLMSLYPKEDISTPSFWAPESNH